MVIGGFTSTASYGLHNQDRDMKTKAIGKTYGIIFGIADVCRKYCFTKENFQFSRKIWVISELITQEVLVQSARYDCNCNQEF